MSEEAAIKQTRSQTTERWDWENPPMPPTDLIFDDGEPLESNRHRIAMNTLIWSLRSAQACCNDFIYRWQFKG